MKERFLLDSEGNVSYCKDSAEKLLEFGKQFPSPDGGSYYLGSDGMPIKSRPRETWITARMLHVYSIGAMAEIKDCRELAEAALLGLKGELKDKENGGWYAGIVHPDDPGVMRNSSGAWILPGKQCYAHAFVILAGCSAVKAGLEGADEFVKEAMQIYDRYFWDPKAGLSCDFWDTEFKVCDDYRGLNANMHSVEAFLAVHDILGNREYMDRAGSIVRHTLVWAKENDYRLPEHYTSDWKPILNLNKERPDDPFKPYGATPGHGMEWARLITQWALTEFGCEEKNGRVVPGAGGADFIKDAEKLYQRAVSDGWNADGAEGFVYTTDWDGTPVVHDRMHWTLAEAINTSAVLYKVTGKEEYQKDYAMYLSYLEEKVLDSSCGSWYHQLDENNSLKENVWPGKPDLYHAFQAMIIPHISANKSIAVEGGEWLEK